MVKKIKKKVSARVKQGIGKVRRFASSKVRKSYVEEQLTRRKGDCLRCGACCRLLFKCPMLLKNKNGSTSCRIHNRKPENCRIFPLNQKCIDERNHLMPLLPCGYHFDKKDEDKK
ncbi:MAG: hypothetical protein ACYTFY_07510 [Planctomycetota bacterium]|jgi:Fe-S-cluster containining protein